MTLIPGSEPSCDLAARHGRPQYLFGCNTVRVHRLAGRDRGFARHRGVLVMSLSVVLGLASCGSDGGGVSVESQAAGGDRSTAVYEIRMQSGGSDLLVVRAADAGDFESIDVRVPATAGIPEQRSTAFWYEGKLYESTTDPEGRPDYDVYDPAKPMDVVGASVLGEFTARSFVESVEEAYARRADSSSEEFVFVANNSAAVRAAFGGGERAPNAIDFRGSLRFDASGRPMTIDLKAETPAGLRLRATISYPTRPTVATFVPVPQTTIGPCVTLDTRGSYACGPGVGSGEIKVTPIPATTR